MDYNIFHFKDLFEVKHGYPFKSNNFSDTKTKFHIMTPGNVKAGGGIKLDKIKYLEENIEFDKNYIFEPGDIFINLTDLSKKGDTLGFPAIVPNDLSKYYLHNQRLGRVINIDEEKLDKNFLFYLLCTREYRHHILGSATGSTVKHTSPKRILEFEISLPNLKIQKYIGIVLNSIDKKIENNQKIIANLEELSQTLFKRWFVDFEFPDENDNPYKSSGGEMIDSELGKIPKDWKIKKLDDLLNLIIDHRGKTPKKLGSDWSEKGMPAISAKNIKNRKLVNVDKIKFINRETYVKWMKNEVEKGDIILTSEAPLGETYLINEDSKWVLSQRLYAMRTNESLNYIYFWEYVNSHYFQNELTKRSSGSTVTGIRQKELIQILVIVPPLKFQKKYFEILNPLVDDITRRNNEITMLTQLRDTLLPKLMSGEIEIPDDIEVNEDELSI
ncbi:MULTISPECIES: restriction endonuclease subunit S [Staphylococcus]|uniref:restriction endonuclease subunit S n=1 Tax=Staphylococcus TaxID=1279 RepID=UPI000D1E6F7F|nr:MULTISPECIES: restriction endonuclease subunit S [Staphylococcus]MDG0837116.1 restriction endonuclease subunit S [Staphylococcus equorum]PTL12322.1 hypothetical protein BUZ09_01565 [Staphylococcus gallinarum]RIO78361.1 restriction endonuclease subunit S [Staphylococcus gallinarum]